MLNEEKVGSGTIVIVDKKKLTLDGVNNVLSFDEGYVSLDTKLGILTVEGEGLKIESLTEGTGEIRISGSIEAVAYSEKKESKGFFRGLFK